MARINLEAPENLHRTMLVGEWHQIPKIITNILKLTAMHGKINTRSIPKKFTVRTNSKPHAGNGHLKFFYDKLLWLRTRYLALMAEMEKRGYKTSDNWRKEIFEARYTYLFNDWEPSNIDISLSRERIVELTPIDQDFTEEQKERLRAIPEYQNIFKNW